MADEKKKEDEEEELLPVGEGADEVEESSPSEKKEKVEDDDLDEDGDEDEDEEGTRLGARDEEDEQREARRNEKKTRRQRQKEARDRNQRELQFLRSRNDVLERRYTELDQRVGASEASQIDARINHLRSSIKKADQVMASALEKQDGARFTEAQEIRDELRDNLSKLEAYKGTHDQRSTTAGARQAPPFVTHAAQWMRTHDWWDPEGGDADSKKVSAIDDALVKEGYDPNSPLYWSELSQRVDRALPHRAPGFEESDDGERNKKTQDSKKSRSKGPTFRTNGRERPLKSNEVYINAERKQAMIDAGVWQDATLRQKYLKQYRKYDEEHASS